MGDQTAFEKPDDAFDITSMLEPGTSGTSQETDGNEAGTTRTDQGSLSPEMAEAFKFAGRNYKTRLEAEQAHNKLYGKYSDQQNLLKQLKASFKDPKTLSALSKNPEWAPILAKLGIEEAQEELESEEANEETEGFTPEALYEQIQVDRASLALDREEMRFERDLGRPVTDDEHRAVMSIIQKAGSLSYKEAWKLAFHDKILKELHAKHQTENQKAKQPRPSPTAAFIPGVKMDLKKPVTEMTAAEFREHLRNSEEFKQLMSRE